jgi:N-acetylmuramoyl-L-alanine amidase
VETINAWHIERGFSGIGYHYVILKDGSVCPGRPEDVAGAHCRGHNTGSIGICLTGRKLFTREQFLTLEKLVKELCQKYKLEMSQVLAHSDLDSGKTCPNFNVKELVSSWK